jgi:ribulose-phosphate 3-epimerase
MLAAFARAGADILTVHIETCPHIHQTIQQIKALGMKAGVTLNPGTPLVMLENILADVDQILIMSVNPGFSGQRYIAASTDKIARLRAMLNTRGLQHVAIEVDGGVKPENAAEIVAAGANILVAGSAIYNQKASIAENIAAFRQALS